MFQRNQKKFPKGLKLSLQKWEEEIYLQIYHMYPLMAYPFAMKKVFKNGRWRDELNISYKHHSYLSIMDLIVKVGLSKSISNVGPFYPSLIGELIVNLPSKFNAPSSSEYQLVQGSPFIINTFLGNDLPTNSLDP